MALPWRGVDFALLKRANLLIALAALAVLVGHRYALPWIGERRNELGALAALAVLSLVVFFNFFSFHGERTWVHLHDVAHSYLGAKYFPELGYGSLYTAMLRAEAESFDNQLRAPAAPDLAADRVVPVRELLAQSEPVKARFSPVRWRQFQIDVAYFRAALGPHYAAVFVDHGFNPTPVWAAIGGALANRVRAGDARGIFLLTLLDPLLLLAAAAVAARAFGVRAALLATIQFCILFGATFGWTGGAYLRYLWFFGVAAAVCLLRRGRPALAGAALGLAAALRIFPALFLWGVLAGGVAKWIGSRALPRLEASSRRQVAARQRAATSREQRAQQALELLPEAESKKPKEKRGEARVSTTDPEASVMKMADGGLRPAYNGWFAVDTGSQIVTDVMVSTLSSAQAA